MRKKLISMSIVSTFLTVRGQPSPWFHVEAWLPFRNCDWNIRSGSKITKNSGYGPFGTPTMRLTAIKVYNQKILVLMCYVGLLDKVVLENFP